MNSRRALRLHILEFIRLWFIASVLCFIAGLVIAPFMEWIIVSMFPDKTREVPYTIIALSGGLVGFMMAVGVTYEQWRQLRHYQKNQI